MKAHLDTHVALWMVAGEKRKLRPVDKHLRNATLFVSPIVLVEMEVLREIGRIRSSVDDILDILTADYGVEEASGDLREIGHEARLLSWTRDPFDRFLVAHALAHRSVLLTADQTIRMNCAKARWDD